MTGIQPITSNSVYKNEHAKAAFLKILERKEGDGTHYVRTNGEITEAMEAEAAASKKDNNPDNDFDINKGDLKKLIEHFKNLKNEKEINGQEYEDLSLNPKTGVTDTDIEAYLKMKKYEKLFDESHYDNSFHLLQGNAQFGFLIPFSMSSNEVTSDAAEKSQAWYTTAIDGGLNDLSDDQGVKSDYLSGRNSFNIGPEGTREDAIEKYQKLRNECLAIMEDHKLDQDIANNLIYFLDNKPNASKEEIMGAIITFFDDLSENYPSLQDYGEAANVYWPSSADLITRFKTIKN